jgi:hypothetical protein
MPNFNTVKPPHAQDACISAKNSGVACRNIPIGKNSVYMSVDANKSCLTVGSLGNNKKDQEKCQELNPDFDYVGGSAFVKWPERAKPACRVAVCQRMRNGADPTLCCLNKSDGLRSCENKYIIGNAECDGPLGNYCVGPRLITDPKCKEWSYLGSSQANTNTAKFCTSEEGLAFEECKNWCRNPTSNGACDSGVKDWCGKGTNMETDFCRCLKDETKGGMRQPACFDSVCKSSGYHTETQRNNKVCGTLIQCTQNVDFGGMDNIIEQNEVIQNCEGNAKYYDMNPAGTGDDGNNTRVINEETTIVTPPTVITPNTPSPEIPAETKQPDNNMNILIIFFIVILVLSICGGVGYYFYTDREISPNTMTI